MIKPLNQEMKQYFEQNENNRLIHFTGSLKTIISILKSGSLRLKYCKEDFSINYENVVSKSVHPMVCFSEQDTTNLHNKEITYGKYGIAFQPEWIISNNIQPVMYIEQNSLVAQSLGELLVQRRLLEKGNELSLPIMTIKCFVKNTIGYNSYLDMHDFLFKQENEWRYVPTKDQIGNGYISESRGTFLKKEKEYNNRLLEYPLKFKRDSDITCIYYEKDSDRQILEDTFSIPHYKLAKSNWNHTPKISKKSISQTD